MTTLDQRIRDARISITVGPAKRTRDDDGWEHDAYRVQLTRKGQTIRVPFRKGTGHNGNPPQVEEVLEALVSDASGVENALSFEEWADEYGYDTDSRKAETTYRAVVRQTEKLRLLLGDEYEAFLWETDDES